MCITLLAACSCLALPALAQTAPAAAPQQDTARPSPRVERITHEDKLSRIEELRVGGQTQSIEVQPKNGAPAYNITPQRSTDASGNGPNQRSGNAGKSSWRVLSF
jgi:hypothetical protein